MPPHSLNRIAIGLLIASSIFFGFVLSSFFHTAQPGWADDTTYPLDGPVLTESPGNLPDKSFTQISEEMAAMVVNIEAWKVSEESLVKNEISAEDGTPKGGSGIILDQNGYILTNWHVVEQTNNILVRLLDNSTYSARVVGADDMTDLALLKIQPRQQLKSAILGDSDKVRTGEWVVAIGNPSGLSHSVTVGVVSAIKRDFGMNSALRSFIQTDAAINPGNSGGPLMNSRGEVIGVNTLILEQRQNLGFSVPINLAKLVIRQLKEKGKVERGYIGLTPADITEEMRQVMGLRAASGAIVQTVQQRVGASATSPAAQAGFQIGDVITSFDGQKIKDKDDLYITAAYTPPGKQVEVEILREGEPKTLRVTLAKRESLFSRALELPEPIPMKRENSMGISVKGINSRNRQLIADFSGQTISDGVRVTKISVTSPAFNYGLRNGQIISRINGSPVSSSTQFEKMLNDAVAQNKPLIFYVITVNDGLVNGRYISIPKKAY